MSGALHAHRTRARFFPALPLTRKNENRMQPFFDPKTSSLSDPKRTCCARKAQAEAQSRLESEHHLSDRFAFDPPSRFICLHLASYWLPLAAAHSAKHSCHSSAGSRWIGPSRNRALISIDTRCPPILSRKHRQIATNFAYLRNEHVDRRFQLIRTCSRRGNLGADSFISHLFGS